MYQDKTCIAGYKKNLENAAGKVIAKIYHENRGGNKSEGSLNGAMQFRFV